MFDKLERLREKSEAYRKRLAFIVAASISGVIFLIWLSVLSVRLGSDSELATGPNSVGLEPKKAGMFTETKQGFSNIFETGKEQFDNTKMELEGIFQQQTP